MFKFSFLFITTTSLYFLAYISIYLMRKDYFESRINTKDLPESIFYRTSKVESTAKDPDPIPNTEYPYVFTPIHIDSTNDLNFSSLSCRPVSFGYPISQGEKVFPEYIYPNCSDVTDIKQSKVSISRPLNKITIDCEEGAKYYSGPVNGMSLMKKEHVDRVPLQHYSEEIPANQIEFLLAKCKDSDSDFDHAGMVPEYKESLFTNSRKFVQNNKPKIITLVTLDSMSRRHFYRKLPTVVNFLNESEQHIPDMVVYDYKLHTTFGSDTTHNQKPVFGGIEKPAGPKNDKLGDAALWNIMKKKGFITMMGNDDCDKGFPRVFGENINIDYATRQFFCLINIYSGLKSAKNETEQRCLGPYQGHYYVLNYTLEFTRMYKGANLWIYLHLNAAHERSGQHAATLDKDLTDFLKKFFYETRDSQVFMFLGGDHGMRYGGWYKSIHAYQETRLPSMFVIGSKSWVSEYPFSHHLLEENSKRLTTKTDIRETVLQLIDSPEKREWTIDWLTEMSPYSRDCKDLKSNMIYCACPPVREIKSYNTTVEKVLLAIKALVEKIVNEDSYYFKKYPPGKYCDYIEMNKIKKFYHMPLTKKIEVFRVELGNTEKKDLRFEVNALVSTNNYLINDNFSTFKPVNLAAGKFRYRIKVIQISRLDKYSGKCQNIAEGKGIPPEFCIRSKCSD